MKNAMKLRVVMFRDGDSWVAQCLEYDIGAQAPDLPNLEARFALTALAEYRRSMEKTGEAFGGIDPSPKYFQDMWETCSGEYKPRMERPAQDAEPTYQFALCA